MSEAMWDDDTVRARASSSADVGAMARRPSLVPSAGPLPIKPLPVEQPYTPPESGGPAGDDFVDLESGGSVGAEIAPDTGDLMAGDPAAGRAGLWAQGAPPTYGAQEELPPAYSEQDPHPQQAENARLPWWKRAKRSFGRGLRKVAGFLGLGSLLGR